MATKPPALRRGDTIGVVTLGSPLDENTIRARISYLERMGYKVVVGKHAFASDGYLAGNAVDRAEDLMAMFADPRVKLILPTRGGVGVEGVLPYLDYAVIRANPKLLSGYSDITVLLNALYQFADIVALHSLLLLDFKPETQAYNFLQFFGAASNLAAPRPVQNPPGIPFVGKTKGAASGPIVGGNLTSLVGTLGTPYELDTYGKILLIEETHEPINTVYRYIEQLRLAGKFQDCAGIVMGECTGCLDAYGKTFENLIEDFIVPLGKPTLTGLASGHGSYKAAVPIGTFANLNADNSTFTLLEPAVS